MSSIILIVVGVLVGGWAAKANTVPLAQRPVILQVQPLGGLIQFICQIGGLGLIIYGVVSLFSK